MRSILRASLVGVFILVPSMNRPAIAQSASEQMHSAGVSAENAVSDAYHGTATAVKDSTLTAKIKTALHDDKVTSGADIHVTTVAKVVTLRGSVKSADISSRAEEIARNTSGVKDVTNKLKVQ